MNDKDDFVGMLFGSPKTAYNKLLHIRAKQQEQRSCTPSHHLLTCSRTPVALRLPQIHNLNRTLAIIFLSLSLLLPHSFHSILLICFLLPIDRQQNKYEQNMRRKKKYTEKRSKEQNYAHTCCSFSSDCLASTRTSNHFIPRINISTDFISALH